MVPPVTLPSQPLGKDGPLVPRIGVGLMNIGRYHKDRTEEERLAFLDAVWSKGETFWDTADEYGDSEDIIGKWLAAHPTKRSDILLCTKFGMCGHSISPDGRVNLEVDSTPAYCKQAVEKSLRRLGVDCIDLYYCHRLDKVTPVEQTVRAMAELKEAGKIKYLGLSECSAVSLRRAHAVHPITAVQVEYGPACLDIESDETALLKTCRELGVAVVCYSPLGNGLLGGAIRSFDDVSKPGDPRGRVLESMKPENIGANVAVVDELGKIAKRKGVTVGQLCLAWLLAQGEDIFPIPGTRSVSRMEENVGSARVEVSPREDKQVREVVEKLFVPRFHATTGFAFADTPPL